MRSDRLPSPARRLPSPRKRFGQHFLEPAWVDKVIRAIGPRPDDTFLEIGPGRGALTYPLAARVARLTAFEIDRDLAVVLRTTAPPNVTIVEGDFLDPGLSTFDSRLSPFDSRLSTLDSRLRVAGNLPYNVASPILFKLIELHAAGIPLEDATVMLQREVADRLTAAPGSRDYGILSVLITRRAAVERLFALPPGAFRPAPKIHSALVRLRFRSPDPPAKDERRLTRLVQAVFTRRRKTLANALLALPGLDRRVIAAMLTAARLDGRRRPETLTPGELVELADVFSST